MWETGSLNCVALALLEPATQPQLPVSLTLGLKACATTSIQTTLLKKGRRDKSYTKIAQVEGSICKAPTVQARGTEFGPQFPYGSQARRCASVTLEMGTTEVSEARWPARLAKLMSFRFNEKQS